MSGLHDPPSTAPRALRRLIHSHVVPTTYLNRNSEAMEADSAAALRRGYDDGYAEGLARAAADAAAQRTEDDQKASAALSALARALAGADESERRMRAEVQSAAPKLAFALVEAILGRELTLAANPGHEAVARALALDEGMQPATVHLNPADVDALAAVDVGRVVRVVADPAVERGGALVEIGRATLDAQIGSAVERVRQILLGASDDGANDDRAA